MWQSALKKEHVKVSKYLSFLSIIFQAEALRYGEGVGEADQDDGDSLADISRRMSIEVGDIQRRFE